MGEGENIRLKGRPRKRKRGRERRGGRKGEGERGKEREKDKDKILICNKYSFSRILPVSPISQRFCPLCFKPRHLSPLKKEKKNRHCFSFSHYPPPLFLSPSSVFLHGTRFAYTFVLSVKYLRIEPRRQMDRIRGLKRREMTQFTGLSAGMEGKQFDAKEV